MTVPQGKTSRTRFRILLFSVLAGALLLEGLSLTGRLDRDAPLLQWQYSDPGRPIHGQLVFDVAAFDSRPGLSRLEFRVDDGPRQEVVANPIQTGIFSFTLDTTSLADGPHTIAVTARDRSLLRNAATETLELQLDNTPPQVTLAAPPAPTAQGGALAICLLSSEELGPSAVQIGDRQVAFYSVGDGRYRALVGLGVDEEAGATALTILAADRAGNGITLEENLEIRPVDWPRGGYITLTPAQEKTQKDRSKGQGANDRRGDAYGRRVDAQLWTGTLQVPAAGSFTSPFGKFREYSSGIKRHHKGLDIANALGTPIHASADGIVTLAEELAIYGNAVILAHGHGVSTSYNHLQNIEVEVGQRVQQGDRIATMGSTGQSTGSHLHWGMVVGGVAVDPVPWTESTLGE